MGLIDSPYRDAHWPPGAFLVLSIKLMGLLNIQALSVGCAARR